MLYMQAPTQKPSACCRQGGVCWVQVLAGVHIMFSRVIPLQDGRPELHPMWRKAVKFGATCTTQPSDAVTHVAAYVNGTEKVQPCFLAVHWVCTILLWLSISFLGGF